MEEVLGYFIESGQDFSRLYFDSGHLRDEFWETKDAKLYNYETVRSRFSSLQLVSSVIIPDTPSGRLDALYDAGTPGRLVF